MKQNLLRPRRSARSSVARHPRRKISLRNAFYPRLDEALRDAAFGIQATEQCSVFAPSSESDGVSISVETYFRLLLIGYLERLRSPESIIWHASESSRLRTFVEDLDAEFGAALRGFAFWRESLPVHLQRRVFGELIRITHETRLQQLPPGLRNERLWPASEIESVTTTPSRLNHRLPWRVYLRQMTQSPETALAVTDTSGIENSDLWIDGEDAARPSALLETNRWSGWQTESHGPGEDIRSSATTIVLDTPAVETAVRVSPRPRRVEPRIGPAYYEISKRCLDILAASIALTLLSPAFLVIAVLIRTTSRGPVFFRQIRVGRGGEKFWCYKFRSMVQDADQMKVALQALSHHANPKTFKIRRDPRTTWIGGLLRKFSADEAPQFFNVLRGDMSLVGPRPPVPSEVSWYSDHELRRLEVRPGLTCTWQVSGRGDIPFDQQVQLDIDYIDQRTLWLDLKLLAQTPLAVATGRGAY